MFEWGDLPEAVRASPREIMMANEIKLDGSH
jgi:hypothetical protein